MAVLFGVLSLTLLVRFVTAASQPSLHLEAPAPDGTTELPPVVLPGAAPMVRSAASFELRCRWSLLFALEPSDGHCSLGCGWGRACSGQLGNVMMHEGDYPVVSLGDGTYLAESHDGGRTRFVVRSERATPPWTLGALWAGTVWGALFVVLSLAASRHRRPTPATEQEFEGTSPYRAAAHDRAEDAECGENDRDARLGFFIELASAFAVVASLVFPAWVTLGVG